MSAWAVMVAPLFVAGVIMTVPGYATLRVFGFRGLHAWAFAGPISLTMVGAASILSPLLGLSWTLVGVALVTSVGCAIAAALRFTARSAFAIGRIAFDGRGAVAAALAIGGVLVSAQFVLIVMNPENISQTFDNIFHLNAAQYILDTGSASPLSVSQLTRTQSTGLTFYPAVWHAAVALVAEVTGVTVAVASNAVMIAAGALLWPAGILLLGTTLFGRARAFVVAVGVFGAAIPAFPILMVDYGVLFPYFLALCALPAALASTLAILGIVDRRPATGIAPWIVLLAATVPGLLLVHPAAFVAWLVLSGVAALFAFVRYVRARPSRKALAFASVGIVVAGVASILLWRVLRPAIPETLWPPSQTPGQAIGEALTLSMERAEIPVVVTIAMIVGAVIAWRRGDLASRLSVTYLVVLMALFVITTSMQWLWLRKLITGAWYVNSPRLAAIIPLLAVPIAALAIELLWRRMSARFPTRLTQGRARPVLLAAGATALLVLVTQLIAIPRAIERARLMYVPTASSPLLTPDERGLIDELPDLIPADAVVTGNPGTGAAMAYALAGVEVLHPSVVIEMTDDIALIDDELNAAKPGSAVCAALQRTGVDYVLDFGTQEINGESHPYPGYQDLNSSSAVKLVDRVGDAALYEVVGCGTQ